MPWPNSPMHDVGLRVVQPASYIVFYDPNGNTYHAVTGGTDGSPGTDIASQDIWALLNSIDGQLASNGVYHIHIKGGDYTGTSTFSPSPDHGYLITGDGVSDGPDTSTSTGGTILNYTGAGSAIDTSVKWPGLNYNQHPLQTIGFEHLGIIGKSSAGTLLNIQSCNKFIAYDLTLAGNGLGDGVPVTNSIGLSIPSSANTGHHVIETSKIIGFDKNMTLAADHVTVANSELGNAYNYFIYITGGNEITLTNLHFFNGIGRPSSTSIRDERTPTNGFILTMVGMNVEGMNGYTNVNGGYYVLLGNGAENASNNVILESNTGGGINLTGGQTTLNGTTAGSLIWSSPFGNRSSSIFGGGSISFKKFIGFLNGYRNSTGTPQTVTFPKAYINTPKMFVDDSGGSTVSTTLLTLPISMGAPVTGWIIIEGY